MKRFSKTILSTGVLALCAGSYFSPSASASNHNCAADLSVRFVESAPRDRFELSNKTLGLLEINTVEIDLAGSNGNLIFDTIDGGSGVEVFQPYQTGTGKELLRSEPKVADGSNKLFLQFASFEPGDKFSFSIDVDDQLPNSQLGQIRVSGSEMQGAKVTFNASAGGSTLSKTVLFNANNIATWSGNCS